MTDEDLARRAVRCKHWRWLPGMRYTLPTTSLHGRWKPGLSPHIMPDLDDPATVGAVLSLVRGAYDEPTASVQYLSGSWVWSAVAPTAPYVTARTEARCLILALEHAP
jgi:hypothetical protein